MASGDQCEFVVAELSQKQSVESMLDGLYERCIGERTGAPPKAWGGRSGFSAFDEDAVLGEARRKEEPPAAAAASGDAARGEAAEATPPSPSTTGDEESSDFDFIDEEVVQIPAVVSERRAISLLKASCRLYALEEDSGAKCPVCLAEMVCEEAVWRLPCFHQVHHACAARLFADFGAKPQCPLCRLDIRSIASPP